MKKILYLECESGISGDMTAAALIDLGADRKALDRALSSIPAKGFRTEIASVKKAGIDCCDFRVILDAEHENHDHDMEYLHGHSRPDDHGHHHEHENEGHHHDHHEHESEGHHHDHHEHESEGHHHDHHHTSFADIRGMLNEIDMTETARSLSLRIFTILAEAEAKAHGTLPDEVHFHEVGAIDSIVDIVSCAVCFDSLGAEEVIIPYLAEGSGTVRCQHGILPIPVPAVLNIVETYGIPLKSTGVSGEFVTPTGAAFASAVRTGGTLPKTWKILKTGLGAGKRNYEKASILRAMLIEDEESGDTGECVVKLETDIDDSTGEQLGYTMERLFDAGALEVHYTPVFMKKNRPGYMLTVLAKPGDRERLEKIIFSETTTIGIRRTLMERSCLKREQETVSTPYGDARVKKVSLEGETRSYPEYEDAAEIARRSGRPLSEVYEMMRKR